MNTVKRFTREHNGVNYLGVEDRVRMVVGAITKDDKKWELKGFPKINRTIGSYKHGKEVQITIWNKSGSTIVKNRTPYATKWDTVEIFFPVEVWEQLVEGYFDYTEETAK